MDAYADLVDLAHDRSGARAGSSRPETSHGFEAGLEILRSVRGLGRPPDACRGDLPSSPTPPAACAFHARCQYVQPTLCGDDPPELRRLTRAHHVARHWAEGDLLGHDSAEWSLSTLKEAENVAPTPLQIDIEQAVLDDLQARLRNTRWPPPSPAATWQQGTDLDYHRRLVAYWADEFDWRAAERELNEYPHFRIRLDDVLIHFVHARAASGDGIPLLLTHGWPSAFVELLPLVPLLTDPVAHGIAGPAFDVVLPSLPGYAFSERPAHTGVTYRYTAALWHRLMQMLGYERYGAGGGDFGCGVATFMALDNPQPLLGLHLTNLELAPYTGAGARPLSAAEQAYLAAGHEWEKNERGYTAIQSTKPQTLAYALNDSPAGLAAWVVEKWRSWSDSGGEIESRFSRDFLLTLITLYWVTETMPTSIRDYYDNRRFHGEPRLEHDDVVRVPTAIASFPHMFVPEGEAPREWAERLYNVERFTTMPRGGHFAPTEEPALVAGDIAAFFTDRH